MGELIDARAAFAGKRIERALAKDAELAALYEQAELAAARRDSRETQRLAAAIRERVELLVRELLENSAINRAANAAQEV